MWNVDHSAFLCIFGAEHNRGLSDDVSIPRMIKPPLEGFDPARRPLLFSWNFGSVRLSETDRCQLSKSDNGLHLDQQFTRTKKRLLGVSSCGSPPSALGTVN